MLLYKIRNHFKELPAEAIPSLKGSLWNHLQRYNIDTKQMRPVMRRLTRAITGLAIQTRQGPTLINEVLSTFGQNPAAMRITLQFVYVVRDEATDEDDYETRLLWFETAVESFRCPFCST